MNNYKYYDYSFRNNVNNQNLFNPSEGFIRGNMFSNLYSEYKNYKPQKLNPRNEQEKRLFEIQAICFAAHELNLYLDLNPYDQSMITLFNDYIKKEEELVREYESMYGPMIVNNNISEWVSKKWPWEVDNV